MASPDENNNDGGNVPPIHGPPQIVIVHVAPCKLFILLYLLSTNGASARVKNLFSLFQERPLLVRIKEREQDEGRKDHSTILLLGVIRS